MLTDFDLAYIETNRTVTINMVGGVINYAAPEQFYSSHGAAARAATVDVYAFGQLLFFILLGSDPAADRRESNLARFTEAVSAVFSYEPAELVIGLYRQTTEWDPSARPQDMDEVFGTLTRARISHDALVNQTVFRPEEICRQVAYAYVGSGDFSTTSDGAEFQSRAGTLLVEIKPRGMPTSDSSTFELTLSSSQHFGVPGAGSGVQARLILSQRLDRRLRRFEGVQRNAGNQGYFQTHIKVSDVPLALTGATRVSEILATAIAAIEQLD